MNLEHLLVPESLEVLLKTHTTIEYVRGTQEPIERAPMALMEQSVQQSK